MNNINWTIFGPTMAAALIGAITWLIITIRTSNDVKHIIKSIDRIDAKTDAILKDLTDIKVAIAKLGSHKNRHPYLGR